MHLDHIEHRDYLKTISLITKVYSVAFWEEELCFILNGDRDIQIKYQGGSSEYLKDLLIRAENSVLQESLLKKAIKNFLTNYRFKDVINNIEDTKKVDELLLIISIIREFCVKDPYLVELLSDFFVTLYEERLENKNKFLYSYNSNSIFNGVIYLVSDFLPRSFEYSNIINETQKEYLFLKEYFNCINKFTVYNGEYCTKSLIFLLIFKYPIELPKILLENIIHNEDTLDSLMVEYTNKPLIFKEIIEAIYKIDKNNTIKNKLIEFGIKESPLLSNKGIKPTSDDIKTSYLVYNDQYREKLSNELLQSIPEVNHILNKLNLKQDRRGKIVD